MTRHDVVVIGGSLAGAVCVRQLERLGIDAVALERDTFPRRKVCGGFLSPGGVKCLEQLGLIDDIRGAGAVDICAARIAAGGQEIDLTFERTGLGISRTILDSLVARGARVEQGCAVNNVRREWEGFRVDGITCSVVIDASGKLSRFTKRRVVDEFGVQYLRSGSSGSVLDFSFFEDGYGGTVSIEGGRSNSCFLIKKDAVRRYLDREDCLVTGPLAYEAVRSDFIAIGDALGMLDPFCGEGMQHALETGMMAAAIVARGIRRCVRYEEMKSEYEAEYNRRWAVRRRVGAMIRRLVPYRGSFAFALRVTPAWLLNRMWD